MQDLHSNRTNFCKSQQLRIDELWRFVQDQRVKRRQACTSAAFHLCVAVHADKIRVPRSAAFI